VIGKREIRKNFMEKAFGMALSGEMLVQILLGSVGERKERLEQTKCPGDRPIQGKAPRKESGRGIMN
jgi:hypothetical protein